MYKSYRAQNIKTTFIPKFKKIKLITTITLFLYNQPTVSELLQVFQKIFQSKP